MVAGMGQVLGWDDIIKERNYTFSVRCNSLTGTLIKISAADILKRMRKDQMALNTMTVMSNERDIANLTKIRQSRKVIHTLNTLQP